MAAERTIQVQAATLPAGWVWTHYEDGSGSLDSPDGRHMFSYDLMTSEYTDPVTGKWCFWKDYPEHMNLQPFKVFAEEYVRRQMLPQDT